VCSDLPDNRRGAVCGLRHVLYQTRPSAAAGIGTDCYKTLGGGGSAQAAEQAGRALSSGRCENTATLLLLLTGFFCYRGATTSADALQADTMRWWRASTTHALDALVLARIYVLADSTQCPRRCASATCGRPCRTCSCSWCWRPSWRRRSATLAVALCAT
jgi:hypothetical protein